jgi:hypothetical protein
MDPQTERDKAMLGHFCRHVVALCGRYEHLGPNGEVTKELTAYNYTGTLLEVGGKWFIATAGHCLQSMIDAAANPRVRVSEQTLVDYAGSAATSRLPTPFKPLEHPHYHIDDQAVGVDFGLIHLRSFYRTGLEANGVIPFGPKQWTFPDEVHFENHGIIGFPDEYTTTDRDAAGRYLAGMIKPTMVIVRRVPDDSETKMPRFKGELLGMGAQQSIKGMSGGPILGFYMHGADLKYHLVALQSQWSKDRQVVYGCPVAEFMRRAVAASS